VTYTVPVLPVATRAIRKLAPAGKRRVQAIIELLAQDARPPSAKKLSGRPEWRVRSGDCRLLYRIEDAVLTVMIVDAASWWWLGRLKQ